MTAVVALLLVASSISAAPPPEVKSRLFPSPEDAVKAFVDALRADDLTTLIGILGSTARPLISSGDAMADNAERARFVAKYDEAHALMKAGDRMVLQVGKDEWPLPIPLVREGSAWRFDTAAGREELLARRIGGNELAAIEVCLAFVDAQREYWRRNPSKAPLLHYASRITSTKGKRDGLYWPTKPGEEASPLGLLVAEAQRHGYGAKRSGKPLPYHGYYYRILTAQGPDAPGGAYDYVVKGQLVGGVALVAYPAQWGVSGVMTLIINHDGVVYEKNLGPSTTAVAEAMKRFNPDSTWRKVSPSV